MSRLKPTNDFVFKKIFGETKNKDLLKDLLEAIIALPTDLFYNTGIATYIWIVSKNKSKKSICK